MKRSMFFIPTLREDPGEADIVSHKLMLRAGMIRKLSSGIYTYLPLGYRAIRKVEKIIREEMEKAGAQEVLLSALQPAELWKETGRWDEYGRELMRIKDRHERDFCLGPTHEEVITDLVRREVRSYKELPLIFYQIQTKFRDEIRPRFGIMRAREFIMKDGYSFDMDKESAEETYKKMYNVYQNIFKRCDLDFCGVEADTGLIGGSFSHEYMVIADTGEEGIAYCNSCNYSANIDKAEYKTGDSENNISAEEMKDMEKAVTPRKNGVEEVNLDKDIADIMKVKEGDSCPECDDGKLSVKRGIEVGHLFMLGEKYSKAMSAAIHDNQGKEKNIVMGCYGIGIGRTIAAAIEQNHDEDGIIWPLSIAPFHINIIPLNINNDRVLITSELIYDSLKGIGMELLLDDRDVSPGVKFKDADLIGIPYQVIIGERNLEKGMVEFKNRRKRTVEKVTVDEIIDRLKTLFDRRIR
ncbi:MAG: proline--tRNA ligase [Nitrospirota bacterium]